MPRAESSGRRSTDAAGAQDSGFFDSARPGEDAPPGPKHLRRRSAEELIEVFCTVTGHTWPLDEHGQRALRLFLFFAQAARKNATLFEVERIRVAESIMRRTQSGEQPGRLLAQIEAAAELYHSGFPEAQAQA